MSIADIMGIDGKTTSRLLDYLLSYIDEDGQLYEILFARAEQINQKANRVVIDIIDLSAIKSHYRNWRKTYLRDNNGIDAGYPDRYFYDNTANVITLLGYVEASGIADSELIKAVHMVVSDYTSDLDNAAWAKTEKTYERGLTEEKEYVQAHIGLLHLINGVNDSIWTLEELTIAAEGLENADAFVKVSGHEVLYDRQRLMSESRKLLKEIKLTDEDTLHYADRQALEAMLRHSFNAIERTAYIVAHGLTSAYTEQLLLLLELMGKQRRILGITHADPAN